MKTMLPAAILVLALTATLPAGAQQSAADERFAQAMGLAEQGDFAGAVAVLEPLRNDAEPAPLAMALLGALHLQLGQPADALAVLEPLTAGAETDPAVLYNAGRAALALGRMADAERFLMRSLEADPSSVAVRELGMLRGMQGRSVEAFQMLRQWAIDHPRDREARLAAALAAVDLGRVPDAERLLDGLDAADPQVELLQGKVLLLKGQPREAIAVFEKLLAADLKRGGTDLRRVLADAYLVVGDSTAAIGVLEGKVGGDPRPALLLARAYYQGGRLDDAIATLEPFAARLAEAANDASLPSPGPLGASLALEYGRMLLAAGRAEDAVPFLEQATALNPADRQGWQSLGQALMASGRTDEGQQAMERFLELAEEEGSDLERKRKAEAAVTDPTGQRLREALARAEKGETEEALAAVREQRELAPEDPRPRLHEVQLLLVLGKMQEALTAVEATLERFSNLPDAHYLRGVVELGLDRKEAAERDLRRALELAPGHTAAMNDLAVLLIVQDRRDEARTLLEQVLELRPDDAMARNNLDRLNAGRGSSF